MVANLWISLFCITFYNCASIGNTFGYEAAIKHDNPGSNGVSRGYRQKVILKPLGTWSSDAIKGSLMGSPNLGLLGQSDSRKLYYDRREVKFIGGNKTQLCYHLPVYSPQSPKINDVVIFSSDSTLHKSHITIHTGRTGAIHNDDFETLLTQLSYSTDVSIGVLKTQMLDPLVRTSNDQNDQTCDFLIIMETIAEQNMSSIIVVVSVTSRDEDEIHRWAVFSSKTAKDQAAKSFYWYEAEDECDGTIDTHLVPVLLNDHVAFPAMTTIAFTEFSGKLFRLMKDVQLSLTHEEMRMFYCSPGSNLSDSISPIEKNKEIVLDRDETLFYWDLSGLDLGYSPQLQIEKRRNPDLYSNEIKLKDAKIIWTLDDFKHECTCNFSTGTFDQMASCVRNSPVDCVLYANTKLLLIIDRRDVCLSQSMILIYLDKHVLPPKFTKVTRLNAFGSRDRVTAVEPILADIQGLNHTHQCEVLLTKSLPSTTVVDSSRAMGLSMSVFKGINDQTADIVLTAEAVIRKDDLVGDKPVPTDMRLSSIHFVYNVSVNQSIECPDLVNDGSTIPEVLSGTEDQMEMVPTNCQGLVVATLAIQPKSGFKCHVEQKYSDRKVQNASNYDYVFQLAQEHFHIYNQIQLSLVHMETEETDCETYALYDLDAINTTLSYDIVPADVCNDAVTSLNKIGSGTISDGFFASNQYPISIKRRRIAVILYTAGGQRCIARTSRDGGAELQLTYPFVGRLILNEDISSDTSKYLWML